MNENGKTRHAETIPGIGEERIMENVGGDESNYSIL
jgi:hypothetical protein